tara:strand:+ start:458 stop:625 length:168 start_codon:yes stop_codon:yes gene_type:complete
MKLTDNYTTISLTKDTWVRLNKLKASPGDTYDKIINDLIKEKRKKNKVIIGECCE